MAYKELYLEKSGQMALVRGWIAEDVEEAVVNGESVMIASKENMLMRSPINIKKYRKEPYRVGNHKILFNFSGFIVGKNTPWKKDFDAILRRLVAMGIVDQLIKWEIPLTGLLLEAEEKLLAKRPKIKAFTMEHIASASFVLAAGLVMAFAVFVAETQVGKKIRKL